MSADDQAKREERAKRLKDQINRLTSPCPGEEDRKADEPPDPPDSPRDFIHKKMRDLDRKDRA